MILTIIAFVVILSVIVLIHELGHFLTAKKFGIKVEEFGFGFPPRLFGIKRGETIYSINWLPVGGFVKLYGEDEAGSGRLRHKKNGEPITDIKRAFFARPPWQKAVIVLAGVFMNFVLAVTIISFLFSTQGVAIPTENVKITEVRDASPAATAGLLVNDEILQVNDKTIKQPGEFITETRKNQGKQVSLLVERGESQFTVVVTPRKEFPKGEGPLGVAITNIEVKKYPWYQAPLFGTIEAAKFSYMIFQGLVDMVSNLIVNGRAPEGVAGPIGVAELTGQAVSYGFYSTLWFVALLSLNLAVINILPIPALDGGRLFFILIEFVTRKKVSPKYESMAHAIGLAVLLLLILFITFFDVTRILSGQSILPEM